ncbi:sensor histidine kinase [Nocardia flavorosea]|uniref:sensor histidine kinase n=1 Tax=Nocardia flavorosea TaxID=53429 RepID=UPI0024557349|nr:histidine kinase [Nocardia flavorosea]
MDGPGARAYSPEFSLGRPRVKRVAAWWRALPGPAKFRLYMRLSLQGSILGIVVVMVVVAPQPLPAAGIAVAGIAAAAAIEARPEFATWATAATRQWMFRTATVVLAAVWAIYALVPAPDAAEAAPLAGTRAVGLVTVFLAAFAVIPYLRYRWLILAALAFATGVSMRPDLASAAPIIAVTFFGGAFVLGTMLISIWGIRMVDELERTKDIEAELQLAQERLRFARDLHDVVGRGFSAIAVKSELAVALSKAGETGRAAGEMDSVRSLAVESMGQMRALVRGYRDIDLREEVAGARSLLSAVECALVVEGDPAAVPARYHEVAAWVVREGTTNIVEHSAATSATLTLGTAGISLRNNRPHPTLGARSGLRGLSERLAQVGATLEAGPVSDEFVLEIHWEKK